MDRKAQASHFLLKKYHSQETRSGEAKWKYGEELL
jgi:hypothetical protein